MTIYHGTDNTSWQEDYLDLEEKYIWMEYDRNRYKIYYNIITSHWLVRLAVKLKIIKL